MLPWLWQKEGSAVSSRSLPIYKAPPAENGKVKIRERHRQETQKESASTRAATSLLHVLELQVSTAAC